MVRRLFRSQKAPTSGLSSRRFYLCVVVGSMFCLGVGLLSLKSSSSSVKEQTGSSLCAGTSAPTLADANKKQSEISFNRGQTGDASGLQNGDRSYGNTSSVDVKHAFRDGIGSVTTRHDSRMLPVVARELLQNYQGGKSCVLVSPGYLDLCGNAWMCMIYGGDWIEMCLVTR